MALEQVEGDGGTGDAAPDDDGARLAGQRLGGAQVGDLVDVELPVALRGVVSWQRHWDRCAVLHLGREID